MSKKPNAPSRLMAEMTELAADMHANGTMDEATFANITRRRLAPA